jgi:hypothetical protein
MHYCSDCNALFFDAIDDSIAGSEPLSNAFIGYFRNYATRARKCERLRAVLRIVFTTAAA